MEANSLLDGTGEVDVVILVIDADVDNSTLYTAGREMSNSFRPTHRSNPRYILAMNNMHVPSLINIAIAESLP
jgi:hypothetical protein